MKKHKLERWFGIAMLVASAVLLTLNMNACGGSKKNGGGVGVGPGPNVGPTGCPGCPANSTIIASAFGQHDPNTISLGLSFFGQTTPNGDMSYYGGPVSATGEFFVGPQGGSQYCPMPPGVYQVNTVQAGQWNGSMVYNLRLQATGPAQVTLSLMQNGVYSAMPMIQFNGRTYPNHMWGNVLVETVNGQACLPQYPFFLQ